MERKFLFKNFVPTSSTHRYCARTFSQIWGASPSDSDITATVVRNSNKSYQTTIEVTSSGHTFECKTEDETLLVCVSLASEKFRNSIGEWKNQKLVTI
jgi:hypothetical protein